MKVTDFIVCTFEGDTASPLATYAAEIISIDPIASFFTCRITETGRQYTFQVLNDASGPWQGSDDSGADCTLATHDIFTAGGTDPAPSGTAVVTFTDNARYLCYVNSSTADAVNVTFYTSAASSLTFNLTDITASNWSIYPTGTSIISIEGYVAGDDQMHGSFNNGWWSLARQRPAFHGRVGGNIQPFATVVHTTDMVPESWNGLVKSWTTQTGAGDCAHFLVGRDETHGVVQFIQVTHNGNHAGGNGAGTFTTGAQSWHPNLVSVGIELRCAGILQKISGQWRLVEDGNTQGGPLPDADVIQDPANANRGWHKVTDYQYAQLSALLDGLETVLAPLPEGCVAKSIEEPPAWGKFTTGRVVGHVSLTAARRGDPWPPTCDWIRARR